jgi:hypothetical protein
MEPAEQKALDLVVLRLHRKYPDVPTEWIRDDLARTYDQFEGSRVRTYLPILAEREVTEHLAHYATAS